MIDIEAFNRAEKKLWECFQLYDAVGFQSAIDDAKTAVADHPEIVQDLDDALALYPGYDALVAISRAALNVVTLIRTQWFSLVDKRDRT